jgi:hypothetical protein
LLRPGLLILAMLPLWSCGPIPVDQAEQICIEDARLAQRPRGTIGFGLDSQGNTAANLTIGISSDYLTGRDPDAVYTNCVYQRSGQMPTRPFSSLPEARF